LVTTPTTRSVTPRKKPARTPISVPTTAAAATDTTAMSREFASPAATRENVSRPNWSVPNQCVPLGAFSACDTS
jgi:hypothetical protein